MSTYYNKIIRTNIGLYSSICNTQIFKFLVLCGFD